MNAAISIENLIVNYGEKAIIHNFNLSIPQNIFLAIVGHNGCGKSTLLKTISGLQKANDGVIKVLKKEISLYKNVYKEGVISVLSQSNQIGFDIKVKELLLMGRHRFSTFFSNYSTKDLEEVNKIALELDIHSFLEKSFLELSGGEQQLILFAQTILQDTKVIILDEPTQNLDIKNGYKIIQYLDRLVKEKQKTVIISTHDLHHLSNVEGQMLNMSSNLDLEKISTESIAKNVKLLRA